LLAVGSAGCTLGGMEFSAREMFTVVIPYAAEIGWSSAKCAVTGCWPSTPEGMHLVLVAEDQLGDTPVAFEVDERGRFWIAEGSRSEKGAGDNRRAAYWLMDDLAAQTVEDRVAYIEKWAAQGEGNPLEWYTEIDDVLRLLEDTDGDGVADRDQVVARFGGVSRGVAAGILVRDGDIWFADIPELLLLRDADGDGQPEERQVLAEGFGVKTSLHGHDMHGLTWGPDGKIYFSIGDRGYNVRTREGNTLVPPLDVGRGAVFRMEPDGSDLEVFATGLRNPQEIAFDDWGNLFTGDNNSDAGDSARLVYVVEGGDSGWSMAFQTLNEPYLRGPWNQEKHWHLQHEGQPAWLLPPIAWIANGPAGLAHYPGVGLPDRYSDHFFLCDYRYIQTLSGVWSFAVVPSGAGFEIDDVHTFIDSVIPTDVDFGYDGTFYVMDYKHFEPVEQRLYALRYEDGSVDPAGAEAAAIVRAGFAHRDEDDLLALLSSPDQRVRQRAQFELAGRGRVEPLAALARDRDADLLARVHAVWGLGQQGAAALQAAGWSDLAWTRDDDPELRAQVLKIAGEAGSSADAALAPALIDFLEDPSARVQYFAALSLGKLGHAPAIPALAELLRRNADADVFLRHAAVIALHAMGDAGAVLALADDESASVRMGALLALRRFGDSRIERFLSDPELRLVVEAARAIHDLPIEAALPALAALATGPLPEGDDAQSSYALHRRAIGANLRLGTSSAAEALARHAANEQNPKPMRIEALAALRDFTRPAPRDRVLGYYRPIEERPDSVVYAALDRYGVALLDSDLDSAAMEIAVHYDRVPLDDDELEERVANAGLAADLRGASLRALAARSERRQPSPELRRSAALALASTDAALRADARDVLAGYDGSAAIEAIRAIDETSQLAEAQRGYAVLAVIASAEADALIEASLGRLATGSLPAALALDVVEAAETRAPSLDSALREWRESFAANDPLAARRLSLAGGDPQLGRIVFSGSGDCMRCHRVGDEGGSVGPPLTRIGSLLSRERLLESMVDPTARIAPGYGTVAVRLRDGSRVTGTLRSEDAGQLRIEVDSGHGEPTLALVPLADIAERSEAASAMPAMGRVISLRELRDVVAYLASLR
jgi:quinoprotein glucose dehydrogenase